MDFAAALDSVNRGSLWREIAAVGTPLNLLRLTEAYYLPLQLYYRLDFWSRLAKLRRCSGWYECPWTEDLDYVNDILLLNNNYKEMQSLLETVNHHAAAVGMRINT